ncbi:MAG: HlyD family secretion protein [Amaricoccus sp.]|uniref:HlyD family secretion protein n=1 Tax=Amaricoccus sp. TaxID=1872485 RepID=UPI0039E69CC3
MPKDFEANPTHAQTKAEAPETHDAPPAAASPSAAGTLDAPAPDTPATPRRGRAKYLLGGVLIAAIALGAWYGYSYWTVGRFMVSTDDAYVQADFAIMAPKITGYVAAVPAVDNQAVKAGDPLVVLDDGDYRDALALAQSQLASEQAAVARIDSQAAAADAATAQARARVDAAQAQLDQAAADLRRYQDLAKNDVASAQRLEQAQAASASATASLAEARAGVASAQANREVIVAQKAEAEATLSGLSASRDKAQRDLDATTLRAPFDGTVGNLSVAVGDLVSPGKRLLAVVPLSQVYVEANFKETQIGELTPGTHVRLEFDAFPGREITGTVEGVAPASGAQFSLLPPENATGNFTKVVQRVPVRVAVPADVAAEGWLRPGLSVSASADIRTASSTGDQVAAK